MREQSAEERLIPFFLLVVAKAMNPNNSEEKAEATKRSQAIERRVNRAFAEILKSVNHNEFKNLDSAISGLVGSEKWSNIVTAKIQKKKQYKGLTVSGLTLKEAREATRLVDNREVNLKDFGSYMSQIGAYQIHSWRKSSYDLGQVFGKCILDELSSKGRSLQLIDADFARYNFHVVQNVLQPDINHEDSASIDAIADVLTRVIMKKIPEWLQISNNNLQQESRGESSKTLTMTGNFQLGADFKIQ